MAATGIICEYNPLHLGHKKQIDHIRRIYPNDGIVCMMSGNYVQRGAPAIIDKSLRAKAAILSGADLVLELPVTGCLSSAEGFAQEGVRLLSYVCDRLCFGAESADKAALLATANALLSAEFPEALKQALSTGLSFPAARQAALLVMGLQANTLSQPNDILATEYCKAILDLGADMEPMPIRREGGYHDTDIDADSPSATAVRKQMVMCDLWQSYVPDCSAACMEGAVIHTLQAGEDAILYKLRTMTDEEYEALPYGSEGLWRKLMQNARKYGSLEEILSATKSKRYTRTRLDRMVMCAFLGIAKKEILSPAPYCRVLAFNDKGRELLKTARQNGSFPNAGERIDNPYQDIEERSGRLYSLFATNKQEAPFDEGQRRVFYKGD